MENKLLENKIYLYWTEFFAGMSIMAVELAANRLLAPYFSSSQIVWTIVIGTIMIAMALGNVKGGKWADQDPDPGKLYRRFLIAGIWIACIPVLGKYVILLISGLLVLTISMNFLIIAALAACLAIFVYPMFLLGTTTPSLARYCVRNLENSGKVVGTLEAYNTVGSIIGTFLPTFVTIPSIGTAWTFLIFSGILIALAVIYFRQEKAHRKLCVLAIALWAACAVLGHDSSAAFWDEDLSYEGESIYNYLQVKEDEESIRLSTNVLFGVQSIKMKSDTLTGMYYDAALAAPLMSLGGRDILILGNGTGTYAAACLKYYDGVRIEGVEIDQKITDLARKYFDMPEEVEVTAYDGRAYLRACGKTYDVIMVDAFRDLTVPAQMSSREFFEEVKNALAEGGVMVVNLNLRGGEEESVRTYLSDTIASVFPYVVTYDVGQVNQELFASTDPEMVSRLQEKCAEVEDDELRSLMQEMSVSLVPCEGGSRIMTDDCSPVDLLGVKAVDEIIAEEVVYYRRMIRRYGIEALFR